MNRNRRGTLPTGFAGVFLGVLVFGLSVWGKHHFGPLDAFCNGSLGLEPNQGAGAIANCSLDTTLYSLAVLGFWIGIAMATVGAITVLIRFWGASQRSETPGPTRPRNARIERPSVVPAARTTTFCGSCGSEIETGDRFCAGCGEELPAFD